MSRPMPFEDDSELAIAALQSLMSRTAAAMLVGAINLLREEAHGSRETATPHPGAAHRAADPAGAPRTDPNDPAAAGPGAGRDAGIAIPDRITALVGWRAWRLDRSDEEPRLLSMHSDECWHPDRPFAARCEVPKRRHMTCTCPAEPAPALNCRCGVYAARELASVARYVNGAPTIGRDQVLVLGRVALWGRAIEYEHGWRAQFAYPQALYVPDTLRHDEHLASFGVPVLSQTELDQHGWEPNLIDSDEGADDAPLPDAPGIPPAVAGRPVNAWLARALADTGIPLANATRFVHGVRRRGAHRLGQLLALSYNDLRLLSGVGPKTVDRFRVWRIAEGHGDLPAEDVRPVPTGHEASPPVDADPEPASVASACLSCGSAVWAHRRVRALCDVCRPINAQLSIVRSAAKRAAANGLPVAPYEALIAQLEGQRPHPSVNGTTPPA